MVSVQFLCGAVYLGQHSTWPNRLPRIFSLTVVPQFIFVII